MFEGGNSTLGGLVESLLKRFLQEPQTLLKCASFVIKNLSVYRWGGGDFSHVKRVTLLFLKKKPLLCRRLPRV